MQNTQDDHYRKTKYNLHLLQEPGESMIIHGDGRLIRTAASMWGTRFGVWFSVNMEDGGYRITRLDAPPKKRLTRDLRLEERMDRMEDALRFNSIMLSKIHKLLQEREEDMD